MVYQSKELEAGMAAQHNIGEPQPLQDQLSWSFPPPFLSATRLQYFSHTCGVVLILRVSLWCLESAAVACVWFLEDLLVYVFQDGPCDTPQEQHRLLLEALLCVRHQDPVFFVQPRRSFSGTIQVLFQDGFLFQKLLHLVLPSLQTFGVVAHSG